MSSAERVRRHFEREARRFDAIYRADKPRWQRLIDAWFRRVMIERFRLVCSLAPCRGEWNALDVGCGPGHYAIAFAQSGAARVLGVDVSEPMIEIARRQAVREGVSDRCDFAVARFLDLVSEERFDVVVATGYFDYLEDPLADLRRMVGLCQGRIFASFPKRFEIRAPARKLRLWMAGAYVRFYTRAEVQGLFAAAGVPETRLALIDLGRDLLAVARLT